MPETYLSSLDEEALLSLGSMEGWPRVVEVRAPAKKKAKPSVWPGYLLAGVVAAVAYGVHYLPFPPFRIVSEFGVRRPLSAAILAILAGVLVRNLFRVPDSMAEGCKSLTRKSIPLVIVLTGAGLNLAHIAGVGIPALSITLLCMTLALAAAYYFGRMFGLGKQAALLMGAGTAICGTSAIVAVAPLIDAEDEDMVLSIGTVNLLGLVLMFLLPLAGGLLHLDDQPFGVWAGTSIHAVPQVVAAGFAYSQKAGTLATLVKLVRVALLAPMVFLLAALYARRHTAENRVTVHYARLVPPFVWGFLAVAALNTLDLIPVLQFRGSFAVPLAGVLVEAGNIVLTLAMAAIGLEVNLRQLATVGARALATGVASTLVLCAASLALIRILL
ncbi:MAG: putative sulfate exporter family transporter [Acidobacteria bacterium]|nr:putative sulfate exporter family transporter [Acidobacteriota bacterium]